ncbi:MAG: hypothetical protein IPI81_16895 [Flavobacteriales bacterium]|nr:hypothetical protein [Flavobacteriales bacterium]MCC6937825.1 hypothetical protein [Flavobacteriales bacterium]
MGRTKLKGVRLVTEGPEHKRYVQIDLVTLAKEPEAVEEYLDGLIAESRRTEASVSHETLLRSLKKRAARK